MKNRINDALFPESTELCSIIHDCAKRRGYEPEKLKDRAWQLLRDVAREAYHAGVKGRKKDK